MFSVLLRSGFSVEKAVLGWRESDSHRAIPVGQGRGRCFGGRVALKVEWRSPPGEHLGTV